MYKALFISPMIPSFNLAATLRFFTNTLGFEAVMDTPQYAICQKDTHTVHLLPAGQDIGQTEFYLEVDDVDGFWDSIKDKVAGLRAKAPFDRDYGMREVHLEVPHTNTLLFIGQEISGT